MRGEHNGTRDHSHSVLHDARTDARSGDLFLCDVRQVGRCVAAICSGAHATVNRLLNGLGELFGFIVFCWKHVFWALVIHKAEDYTLAVSVYARGVRK